MVCQRIHPSLHSSARCLPSLWRLSSDSNNDCLFTGVSSGLTGIMYVLDTICVGISCGVCSQATIASIFVSRWRRLVRRSAQSVDSFTVIVIRCLRDSPVVHNLTILMKTTDEEEYYPKNSFDRFGDDLCGLVLSYQSLKECFRFECLSKQWQRCVFTRRHTLSVGKRNKVLIKSRVKENVNWIPTHNMQALESVVKKCANITSIDIEIHSEDTERDTTPEEYIRTVIDYHCKEFVNQWPQLKRYQLFMMCLTEPQVRQLYESVGLCAISTVPYYNIIHSAIDMNTTDAQAYPKDSFDRFGDDLCGLVLSYLSLKDSFRYECLSKQWQRCIQKNRKNYLKY
ncbi:unnamed protein product [Oppiella nova]|uniref:F-box domain-containing protein n=1 Tax=Oppiella nova TaxID=334625 RepID=A0A7R9LF06_9ACAR|nr:unnamed protein product [Oppiella nova]CAG2163006.1 unnamed protein product [Oppiella nova]